MSGEKRITIDSTEYRRLLQLESQLRSIRYDLPEVMEGIIRESASDLQRRLEPLEQRQRQFQQAVSNLRTDVRDMERQTAQCLEQQQREMRRALQTTASRLRQETQALISEQDRKFANLMEQERRIREQQIRGLQQQIDAIVANGQRKSELATSWIDTVDALYEFIEKNYRHQQFAPGQLGKLEREIRQARYNVSQNAPEAALSIAQNTYNDLSDLRLELERIEQEWQLWRSAALESAKELLAIIQSNRKCKALDLRGEDAGIDIEVDWWTNGKLSDLEREINDLIAEVADDHALLSTDKIRQIAEKSVPDLRQCLEQIIQEARLEVIGSQLRINIADLVVQALEEKGFSVQDATYEGEDMRNGYAAKVKHLDGNEIVALVIPVEGEPTKNELRLHSYDEELLTEHELQLRAREVNKSLRARGLGVSEPQPTGSRADQSLRDMEVVRRGEHLQQRTTAT